MTRSEAPENWLELNHANWDARVPLHVRSEHYDLAGFIAGRESLRDFEPAEIGSVRDRTLLHLQCHIGLDTLSWARRGAIVTGLDFSQPALDVAATLAEQIGMTSARFVAADVYDAISVLAPTTFDIVYVSIGSLQFLPDLDNWAEIFAALIAPGGFGYVIEGHPIINFVENDGRTLRGDYFSRDAVALDEGTYADPQATLTASASVEWVHHPAEVVSALGAAGLRVEFLHEHDWTDYRLLPCLTQGTDGHWRFRDGMPRLPLRYSLRAVKDVRGG